MTSVSNKSLVVSFSHWLLRWIPCHTIWHQGYDAVPACEETGSCHCLHSSFIPEFTEATTAVAFSPCRSNTVTRDVIMTACRSDIEMRRTNDNLQVWHRHCQLNGEYCCSHQSVASSSVCLCVDHDGHFVMHGLHTFMHNKFVHLWLLLFDCFVCRQNVTCLKRIGITQARWKTW